MKASRFMVSNFRCFKSEFSGFEVVKNINVVVGKNNSGKSCLLDVVTGMTQGFDFSEGQKYLYSVEFSEENLSPFFRREVFDGDLFGNHWDHHGAHLVGNIVECERSESGFDIVNFGNIERGLVSAGVNVEVAIAGRKNRLSDAAKILKYLLYGRQVYRLSAERDIKPESVNGARLDEKGGGATELIANFVNDERFNIDVVRRDFLSILNSVMGEDGFFLEIHPRHTNGIWTVHLNQEGKGLVSLEKSGSGLKTVILVLLNMIVAPKLWGDGSGRVYVFEELENSMHPSLLRRLLVKIAEHARNGDGIFFLTTHSSVMIDMFSKDEDAQIIHVQHDGVKALSSVVSNHFMRLDVLDGLGARPSDIFQANGIIWLEGPSDRIYFNRWIELFSEGVFREGKDYQCAFYGGAVLARHGVYSPDEIDQDKVNLLAINRNAIAICDGDRTTRRAEFKAAPLRIRSELARLRNSYIWITGAKEVESYIPVDVLRDMWGKPGLPPIGQFEPFSIETRRGRSPQGYFQKHSPAATFDKVEFAKRVVPRLTRENLVGVFEWGGAMAEICRVVSMWGMSV